LNKNVEFLSQKVGKVRNYKKGCLYGFDFVESLRGVVSTLSKNHTTQAFPKGILVRIDYGKQHSARFGRLDQVQEPNSKTG
jgi:hypothetical protein